MRHIFLNRNAKKAQLNKCDRHDGFTVIEMIIVLAIMAILMLLVSVGLEGYTEAADRIERNEVAESSYYALQSYLAMAKRQGELEEFTESVKNYNESQFSDDLILNEEQNRIIIESNYEGSDFASYYTNDYLVQHEDSKIVCMKLDAGTGVVRKSNPLYSILFAALKDEDVMEHSFMVEYDSSSGIVRSVFYSKDADSLEYHFAEAEESRMENVTDVIDRTAASLDKKRQGYCGVLETAGIRERSPLVLMAPDDLEIINGDRLYVTWSEANLTDPLFVSGTYDISGIRYTLQLFDQDNVTVAEFVLDREDIWKDTIGTGTITEALDALDDSAETVTAESGVQLTRAAGNSFTIENALNGVAEDRYFVILECLDHTFATQGYELNGEKELYAIVSVEYPGEDVAAVESDASNVESAYFAKVTSEGEGEDADYTYEINCSRHLYNMRQGMSDGEYQIVSNINWDNIEGRAREILFTPVEYESRQYIGAINQYTGALIGNGHTVSGLRILDEGNDEVGLLATSNGNVTGVNFDSANVSGEVYVGLVTGRNSGTISNVTVRNSEITGKERIGGLSGENNGIVEEILVAGTDVSGERYVGGVVGFQDAAGTMNKIEAGTDSNPGVITGVVNVGGAVGGSKGSLDTVNNYNDYAAAIPENRADFGGDNTYIHSNFGGIAGVIEAGVASECINFKPISLTVHDEDGQLNAAEAATYVSNSNGYNMPQYIGGVAGGNAGILKNSYSKVADANIYDPDGSIIITTGKRDLIEIHQGTWETAIGTDWSGAEGYVVPEAVAEDGFTAYLSRVGYGGWWGAQTYLLNLDYEAGKTYTFHSTLTSNVDKVVFIKVQGDNQAEIAGSFVNLTANVPYTCELTVPIDAAYNGEVSLYYTYSAPINGETINQNTAMTLNVTDVEFYSETQIEIETRNYEAGINEYVNKKDTGVFLGDYVGGVAGNNSGTIEFDTGLFADNTLLVDVDGNSYVGGVAGLNRGSISAAALVVEGDVFANNTDAGGAVALYEAGSIPATITNKALVIGESAGGIISTIASADLTLDNCINEGAVFARGDGEDVLSGGGIVANNTGVVTNCSNRGIVTSDLAYDRTTVLVPYGNVNVGGVAGTNYGTVQNCNSISTGSNYISGNYHVGGLVGENISSSTAVAKILTDSTENINVPIFTNAYTQYQTNNIIGGVVGVATGTMELANYIYNGQIVSLNNYEVAAADDGCAVGGIVGRTGKNNKITSCTFTGNISASGNRIGGLVGHIKDAGNQISQSMVSKVATINGNDYVGGLIGVCYIEDIQIDTQIFEAFVEGRDWVGGYFGYTRGLNELARENKAAISGRNNVGGFAGYISVRNNLSNLTNSGLITSTEDNTGGVAGVVSMSAATFTNFKNVGTVRGRQGVGGVIGNVYQSTNLILAECENTSENQDIYVRCDLSDAGGIVGKCTANSSNVTLQNCYNDMRIEGSIIGGLVGNSNTKLSILNSQNGKAEGSGTGVIAIAADGDACGGILGRAARQVIVDQCINYGEIYIAEETEGEERSSRIGGIVGCLDIMSGDVINKITNCKQLANITDAYYSVGGMVGYSAASVAIENCANGAEGKELGIITCLKNNEATGGIGGLVGYMTNGSGELSIKSSQNYADINGDGLVSYLGGSIGYSHCKNVTLDGVSNYGDLQPADNGKVYAIGGLIGRLEGVSSAVANVVNCTSTGNIYHTRGGEVGDGSVGGLIAHSNVTLTIKNSINGKADDENSGNIYLASSRTAGGIIGASRKQVNISDCINYGEIDGNGGSQDYIGGIAGYVGYDDSDNLSTISSCKQYGNIQGTGYYTGGIIGSSRCDMTIENCETGAKDAGTTKGHILVRAGSENVGGTVGHATESLTIRNTTNYGVIEAQGVISKIGGILGYNGGDLFIGNAEATQDSFGAKNYGDIRIPSNVSIRNSGGIIGESRDTIKIYDCENYGNLASDDAGSLYSVGGMVGYIEYFDADDSIIERCTQNGNIYNAKGDGISAGAGGIAGFVKAVMTISNCQNNGVIDTVDGSERNGGIVGANFETIMVQNCTNSGTLKGTGTTINTGGILGMSGAPLTVVGCVNNGILDGGAKGERVGGIVGNSVALLQADNCVNNGDITATEIYAAGGIIGQLDHTGETINTVSNCTQLGNINNIRGVDSSAGAGGIIGFNKANTTISKCYNGSEGDGNKGQFKAYPGAIRIGGIVGANYNLALTVEECINYGSITCDGGLADSGGLIGMISKDGGDGATVVLNNAENNGAISAAGNSYRIGGIIGYATVPLNASADTNKSTIYIAGYAEDLGGAIGSQSGNTQLNGIENQGAITIAGNGLRVAGLIGYNTAELTVNSCNNRGNVTFNGTAQESGGGIGRQNGAANLQSVNNYGAVYMSGNGNFIGGLVGISANKLDMNTCVNEGAVTTQSNLYFGSGAIGSMVGDFTTTLYRVENKGVITATQFAENIGGIIGDFYAPRVVYIDRCVNHAAFTARTTIINYGGIIGKHAGISYFGTAADVPGQELNFGAKNFGGITAAAGGTINNTSGIIGNMISTAYIHEGECYGEIKLNGGAINNAGGIIGYCEGTGDVTIKSTGQFSNITGTSNIGGLIGADIHTGKMVLENSYAVGLQAGAAGQDITIGALIGNKRDVTNLIIINSYGNIYITQGNKIIGGRNGVNDLTAGNTCFNGGTQGYIDQRVAGGDLASIYNKLCATYGLAANYTDVYNSYRQLMRYYPENPNYPGYPAFMQ